MLMKTTFDLPDELVEQARRVVREEGTTLRALVEEGLQRSLEARRAGTPRSLDFPSFGGSGLTEEFADASWYRIREEIYRGQGA